MSDPGTSTPISVERENDESRVYFGPFKSPEKKYLAVPAPFTPSPLRRSPRLSSPLLAQSAHVDDAQPSAEDDGDLSGSRSGTPDNNDEWQDEPSSALATRISRAFDNPSPPPSDPGDSAPPTPDRVYPIPSIPFTISAPASPPLPNGTQPDLISFDSFSLSMGPPPTQPIASTSSTSSDAHNPSVDELLSSWSPSARDISPVAASPAPIDKEGDSEGRVEQIATPDVAEEQAVVDALMLPEASVLSPPLHPDVTVSATAPPEDPPRTPLRRSTRPRRSGTPLLPHLVPLPDSDEDEPSVLAPPSTLKRKRKSEKERDMSLSNENGDAPSIEQTGAVVHLDEDRKLKRRKDRKHTSGTPQRHLGSLSPSSTNLLTHLLPPSRSSPVREQVEPQLQPPPFSFSMFPVVDPASTIPVGVSSPIRVSPARNAGPRSPNKIQLQTPSLNDPNRTPARRIPVEQAVSRGQVSPSKGAQPLAPPLDSRTPVFRVQPQESPARRINVVPPSASQAKTPGVRFGSPTRPKSRERSGSFEPRPPWNVSTGAGPSDLGALASRQRSSSPSRPLSAPIKKGKLPFPLTPSATDRLAPILHSPNDDPQGIPAPAPSPAPTMIKVPRSNLKQPTSRIPRIGVKPYVRPPAKPASGDGSTSLAPAETARSSKVIKAARGDAGNTKTTEPGTSSLKRKRVPSPQSKPRPVVVLRQVPATKPAPPKPATVQAPPSPVKRPAVAKFRMVDLHARPPMATEAAETKAPDAVLAIPPDPPPIPEPVTVSMEAPSSSPEVLAALPNQSPTSHPPSSSPPNAAEPETGGVRRTGRLRKSVFPAAAEPLTTRRKANGQQPMAGASGAFAGMTAVALKQLTSTNTTRNQKYLAAKLETQVVRKEGDRPESPGMKIKTIAQREREERGMQRKARATRRARRIEDASSDADEGGDTSVVMDSDEDELESSPLRHRRGPGDEEDYETPKRVRSGSSSSDEGQEEKKRVKWHRGLPTVVFLDDVEPRTKARPKENFLTKGCLAPTAKALRLDPLGNHPNAESPLKDLVEENVVVKKFVYDNDDDEPAVPVVVVKNTRSKAKKKS